ncbi:hypothetical protein BH23ACT9_BH23ACT9_17040 [soil metagenome]
MKFLGHFHGWLDPLSVGVPGKADASSLAEEVADVEETPGQQMIVPIDRGDDGGPRVLGGDGDRAVT